MADFSALKTAIQTYIKQNGNEEITGEILQEILLSVVTTLGDSAINDLVTALANEVAARQNADGTLQQNITNEATARGNADTALSNRLGSTITAENTAAEQIGEEVEAREAADTALQGLIDGITDNIENGYVYAGIATPSTTPVTGKVFYLALTAGTYTNFGSTEVSQGINILKYNGSAWSLDAFIGIDDIPTPNSPKLVKSGGAFDSIMTDGSAFDISAHFASGGTLATYANLDAALAALDSLSASYKRGGMSVKFVQSSDNKYIQCRCTKQTFSANSDDWENIGDIKNGLEKQITTLYESGKGIFDISNFKHGNILDEAVFDASIRFRVCTPIEITIPYATKVKATTGFRFFYYKYSGETWQYGGGWKTEESFNGGEIVKICIGRETEDTSEITDILEYVSSLNFTTFLSENGNKAENALIISRQDLNSSCKLYGTGKGTPPFEFARGALFNGNLEESVLYRVSQVSFETAERDYYLTVKSGYKFVIVYYNGDSIVYTGWEHAYLINKGLIFKIQVARDPENTSEVADIYDYVSALTMTTYISDLSEAVFSNVLPNYFRKINRLQYTGTAFQRVRAFSNLKLDKDTTFLFKAKYDSALTSTAYVYLMKSDNTEYKTYSIGASGTTEYEFMITPSENLVDAYINVAFAQTSVAADFEISKLPAIHSVVDMNRQSISRKNLPPQTIAVGHTGAHSGVYPSNSIENAMYNVLNNGFKAIEVDVKMTADYIPVLAHEQTVVHEGQTYQINEITFAQATEFGLKPFEPYLVCSKRYGFSLWVDSPFSMSDYKNQCDALVAMMHKYGSTQHIKITVNYAQIPAMRYLATIDNTISIGLIYFRRSFMTESDVIELKNLTNGEVCIEMELDNAITTQDADYINYWRSKGFSFGMFTIYNNNNPVERTKEWADLVDYIVTEYEHTPELLMEYDFPS